MKLNLKAILLVTCLGCKALPAADQLYFTYGFENGNSLFGKNYGQQEYRHSLKSFLEKRMDHYLLSSELSLYHSSLDQTHIQTIKASFSQIDMAGGQLGLCLGDDNARLPYAAGLWNTRLRGASADYRRGAWGGGIFGGMPSYLYRYNTPSGGRTAMGTYLDYRPVAWLKEKVFLYGEKSSLASDTLYRGSVGFGQQMDIQMPWGLEFMLATSWKKRREESAGVSINRSAPWVTTNLSWTDKRYRLSAGMDFLGANFRPLQTKNHYGPRFYASWRPNQIVGLDARFSNQNADGDTLYPTITNDWGAGSTLRLSHLPQVRADYISRDHRINWGGPAPRRYVTDGQSLEFNQKFNQLEMGLKYRGEQREETVAGSMDAVRHLWQVKPQYRINQSSFWLSGEFDRWSDSRQANSGQFNRYRAGANSGMWRGSRAIVELGFDHRTDHRDRSNASLVSNIQLKFNLSARYLLDLSWWSDNNIAQDTGFFYLRDRERLGLSITRRMDISGSTMEGLVYLDANKNGRQDAGEHGLPGVMLNLSDGRRTITDAKGRYSFTRINSSSPSVKVDMATLSAEYNLIGPAEKQAVLGGWRATLVNFAVSALGGVKGRVFVDNNGNGTFDGDDYGMSGVLVVIQPSNAAAVSNGGGIFRITNAPTGQQTVALDPNSIPPDFDLKGEPTRTVNIRQGELANNLEFVLARKVRPVKKVVFGDVGTVSIGGGDPGPAPARRPDRTQAKAAAPAPARAAARPPEPAPPKMSPAEIDALYKEGTRLFGAGDYQGALAIWQRILRSDPGHANARRNLERTRQKLEALKKAKG
jgi:hypothetical protein